METRAIIAIVHASGAGVMQRWIINACIRVHPVYSHPTEWWVWWGMGYATTVLVMPPPLRSHSEFLFSTFNCFFGSHLAKNPAPKCSQIRKGDLWRGSHHACCTAAALHRAAGILWRMSYGLYGAHTGLIRWCNPLEMMIVCRMSYGSYDATLHCRCTTAHSTTSATCSTRASSTRRCCGWTRT
jgi:hypothetical protein